MRETCSTSLSEPAFPHLIGYPPVLTNFCKWKDFILIPDWVKLLGAYSALFTHSSVAGHLGYCEQCWTKHSVCISVTITGAFGVTVLYFSFKSWGIVMPAGWHPTSSVCLVLSLFFLNEFLLLAGVVFVSFLLLSSKTGSHYVAVAGLELTLWPRLASSLQKTACLCFLDARTQMHESSYPALLSSSQLLRFLSKKESLCVSARLCILWVSVHRCVHMQVRNQLAGDVGCVFPPCTFQDSSLRVWALLHAFVPPEPSHQHSFSHFDWSEQRLSVNLVCSPSWLRMLNRFPPIS